MILLKGQNLEKGRNLWWSEIDVNEDTINHYKRDKIKVAFNDKYIENKSKDDENTSVKQYIERNRLSLSSTIKKIKNHMNGKFIWQLKLT